MAITDELREWKGSINTRLQPETVLALRSELNCIADRIDAKHERAMADAEWAAAPNDAQLEELGYIALPLDADSVPIRIGDVVYDCNEGPSEKFNVAIMELNVWGWSLLDSYDERNEPGQCRHHHAQTVEDVLREFAEKITDSQIPSVHPTYEEAIVEYAAKLRLAGEE